MHKNNQKEELLQKLQRYQNFIQTDPHNLSLLVQLADIAYQLGDYALSDQTITEALSLHSESVEALTLKGLAALSQNMFTQAQTVFEQVLELTPDSPEALYNLAYVLMLQEQYVEAEPLAYRAVKHWEQLPQAAELYVSALHFNGKVDEAIVFAENILRINPDLQFLHGHLASLYLDIEDWVLSEQHAQYALSSDPHNTDALSAYGMLALSQQEAQKAKRCFDEAIESYPNNGRAWAGRAMAFLLEQNMTEAEQDLKQAVSFMPRHVGTLVVLAWVQIMQEHFDEAWLTLIQAEQVERNFAEVYGAKSVVLVKQNELNMAKMEMEKALKLDDKSFSGLFAKSLLLQADGDDQSTVLLNKLLRTPVLTDGTSIIDAAAKLIKK